VVGAALSAAALAGGWFAWSQPSVQMLVLSHTSYPDLTRRVQSEPDNWRVQYWFGKRAGEAGDLARAEQALRLACGTDPNFLPAATDLGKVLLRQGRVEESFQLLRMVIGRDAKQTEAQFVLAQLYRTQEAYQRAIDVLEALLRRDPRNAAVLYELGVCQSGMQQPEAAERSFRTALQEDGRNVPALTALSRIRRERSDVAEAELLARRGLAVAPEDMLLRLELARALSLKQPPSAHRKEAIGILRETRNLSPGHAGVLVELGALLAADQQWGEAVDALRTAVQLAPRTMQAHYLLADCYRRLGQEGESRRAEATFKRLQEHGARLQALHTRLEDEPESAALRFRIGDLYASAGDLEAAIRVFRAGLQREPDNAAARQRLAQLLEAHLRQQSENATTAP
jgi:cellulose synthase operon protein C